MPQTGIFFRLCSSFELSKFFQFHSARYASNIHLTLLSSRFTLALLPTGFSIPAENSRTLHDLNLEMFYVSYLRIESNERLSFPDGPSATTKLHCNSLITMATYCYECKMKGGTWIYVVVGFVSACARWLSVNLGYRDPFYIRWISRWRSH